MPRIRRISIKNFRSIHNLEIDVKDLVVLVGDNDCGKSNILRALNLFFNGETNPGEPFSFRNDWNRYAAAGQGRASEISVELDLDLPENYHRTNGEVIRWKKRWREDGLQDEREYRGFKREIMRRGGMRLTVFADPIPDRSRAHSLLRKVEFEYVPAVRSAAFFRTLRGRIYSVISEVAEQGMRATSGDFERSIGEHVEALTNDISNQLGDDARISLPNDLSAIFERLDFLYGDQNISLDSRGDGIKARYIPLILKFIADQKRTLQAQGGTPHTFIWAYEEPENNLEFRRAQELADTFCELADGELTQVFMTTHSPVFYNLAKKHPETRAAFHISGRDAYAGTLVEASSDALFDIDDRMGVMPLIAPYIADAQAAVDKALDDATDLRAKLAALNPNNLPPIFVEGPTEYRLLSDLIGRFRPELGAQTFLVEPPARAGANYVANMLRSWEYRTKHQAVGARVAAAGLIDADQEGQRALSAFSADIKRPGHAKPIKLSVPPHLENLHQSGIIVPICLEQLWPPEVWQTALENDWLEESKPFDMLSTELRDRIIRQEVVLTELFNEDERAYLYNRPSAERKVDWVEHMIQLNDDVLERHAECFLVLLDQVADRLGLQE